VFISFEKSYLSYIVSNEDTIYIEIVAPDKIYNFLILSFLI
jgi:hypothetical protein